MRARLADPSGRTHRTQERHTNQAPTITPTDKRLSALALACASVLSPEAVALAGVELADALFGGRDAAVELGEGVRPCLRIAEIDAQRREQVMR